MELSISTVILEGKLSDQRNKDKEKKNKNKKQVS